MITAYEDLLIPKEKLSEKVEEIVNSRHYLSIVNFHDDGPTTSTTVCSSPEGEALSHISPRLSNSVGIPNKGPVEKPEEPKTNHRGSDDELEDSRWLLLQHRNYSFDSGSAVGCYTLKGARIIGNRIKVKPCEMKFKKSPLTGNLLTSLLFVIIFVLSLTIVALLTILIVVSTKESRTTANNETCFIPTTQPPPVDKPYYQLIWQNLPEQSDISNLLMSSFKPLNIRNNIRWLSERVHVAGTYENAQVMSRIAEQYRNYGFDVKIYDYNVLLSYPDYENPNKIDYKNRGGKWEEISSGLSERIGPKEALKQQWDPRGLVYWNAYSLNGTTEGQIVYANYGTLDDYKLLDKLGVSLKGKIVLCRYAAVYRGDKVQMAEERGASGVIIYSDPFDYAKDFNGGKTFPEKIWLPPSGAQRGTLLKTDGDPETPFFPSKRYAHRTANEDTLRRTRVMPNVPVMPIGYRDAIKIFRHLDGAPIHLNEWRGALNVTYRLNGSSLFRLTVRSISAHRTITNVIATIRGAEEPDRYVLLGNHYDAWVQGSVDPNSGTATLLEMARVLSNTIEETGWRPRRTMMFCQWDAEEFGLIGSAEWVEEFMKPLQQRAVAVLNVDNINGNVTLSVKAVPLLYRAIVEAASKTPTPSISEQKAGRLTVLETWKYYNPKGPLPGDKSVPFIALPGSGSDFQRFITYLGVPAVDLKFESAPTYSYMIYHSMYEIPWTIENLVDTDFAAMTATGRLWLELGRNLADSVVIPFDVHDYGVMVGDFVTKMDIQLRNIGINIVIGNAMYMKMMNNLKSATRRFQMAANALNNIVQMVNAGHQPVSIRQATMLNNRLQNVERAFISEQGIYRERDFYRHLLFTNTLHNNYGAVFFAAIIDPAIEWKNSIKNQKLNQSNYMIENVKIGFTKLQYAIESATLTLNLEGYYDG